MKFKNFSPRSQKDLHVLKKKLEVIEKNEKPPHHVKEAKELTEIKIDIKRTKFKDFEKYLSYNPLSYKLELHNLMVNLPLRYVQGFMDIAKSILLFYFSFSENIQYDCYFHKKLSGNVFNQISLSLDPEDETDIYSGKIVRLCPEIRTKMRTVLFYLLRDYFLPLIEDDFKLFLEYQQKSLYLAEKLRISISEESSHSNLCKILTFFTLVDELEGQMFEFFALLLERDCIFLFSFSLWLIKQQNEQKEIKIDINEIDRIDLRLRSTDPEEKPRSKYLILILLQMLFIVLALIIQNNNETHYLSTDNQDSQNNNYSYNFNSSM